ncbi:MAG: 3-dehydroquinate synthase [Calditrichaeota bacterium]|nr:3-dehydroquinate synthase [Candidatus Cloacimonadota bacterium]MCB1047851.1 3-dehydroquinate synthase [Calditrichota bacterium]
MEQFSILARSHSYPITIAGGQLERVLDCLRALPSPAIVVCDDNLQRCQPQWMNALREQAGHSHSISAGEGSKNLAGLNAILDRMHRAGLERGSPVVAFGGGVVGDLAGLAASLWKRGVPVIQIPTSLLAMVDSSVGGKTAINFKGVKNLVGAFWPPHAVFIDPDLLRTLPREERICGFAEIYKAAWLSSDDWAAELESRCEALLELDPEVLLPAIRKAVHFKARIVEEDEHDKGGRALLNLGHTFGHALEALSGGELRHGQAVLLGLRAAVIASGELKVSDRVLSTRMLHRLDRLLRRLDLSIPSSCRDADALVRQMRSDKKVKEGAHTLILPVRVGEARQVSVLDESQLHVVWSRMLEERATR